MNYNYLLSCLLTLTLSSLGFGQTNPDFYLAENGVTCMCPDADFGDTGTLTINGEEKTFTKRTRAELGDLIAADANDPQIALTCTSGITDLSNAFTNKTNFNQDLSSWDVSNVSRMSGMFFYALSFNQSLNNWDVSNVSRMSQMFSYASSFNQPLDNWDVSNVTDMHRMFRGADSFNQSLNNWDVSNVTDMRFMFFGADNFNQSLDNWIYNSDINLLDFLSYSGVNSTNYEALLESFYAQDLTNKTLGAFSLAYCDETFRTVLIDEKEWVINGDLQGQCGEVLPPSTTPFVTVWEVTNEDLEINLYTSPIWDYNYNVDWGDGSSTTETGDATHVYTSEGQYTVSITGVFPYFRLCKDIRGVIDCDNNANKLLEVSSWGDQRWRNLDYMFSSTNQLNFTASDTPDLSEVTSMRGMFFAADNFNQPLNNWDVSNVINMREMFFNVNDFDQPLGNWDVSNVTDMSGMFTSADAFNQPLNNWDVSNVTDMREVFSSATAFNQNINSWDVSNVTNMYGMFLFAESFNQPLNDWDVSNVINMYRMFAFASSFNQTLNNWDVSNVTNLGEMFILTSSFNQPLDNWDVSNVTNMYGMFSSAEAFNLPIGSWDVSNVTNMDRMFRGSVFNQVLTDWCVEQFSEEPIDFSTNSALQESFKPYWGVECESLSVDNPTEAQLAIKLYPNPTTHQVTITSDHQADIKAVSLYNMLGQKLKQLELSGSSAPLQIDVADLAAGNYFIQITTKDNNKLTKRFIKR